MRILLVCAAGMSTSILVEKVKKIAKKRNLDIKIAAKSNNSIIQERGNWDVCLIGPQVRFALDAIKNQLQVPTEIIDLQAYAFGDGEKVLEQALNLYNKR